MKRSSRRSVRNALSLVLIALAMLATAAVQTEPAAANITESSDWQFRSSDTMEPSDGYDGNDLSGVTVDSNGGIYAVDNKTNSIYCLSNPTGSNWQAEKVTGVSLDGLDIEGIAHVRGGRFAVSWEDGPSDASGVTEIGISGLTSSSRRDFDLPGIFEETRSAVGNNPDNPNDNFSLELGGAEGIVFRHGEDKFWVVQEGKHEIVTTNGQPTPVAVPTLWPVDTRDIPSTSAPITLKDQAGNRLTTDASGIAKEPGDRYDDTVWVVSQQDRQIRKFDNEGNQIGNPINSQLSEPEGLAFTPDGIHMIVVGEGSDIAVFAQSASNAPLPRGNCTGEPVVCSPLTISTRATTVDIGDTFEVTVGVAGCTGPISRTEYQVSGGQVAGPWQTHEVNGPLASHSFTMTALAEGTARVQAVAQLDYTTYVDDGSTTATQTSPRILAHTEVIVTPVGTQTAGSWAIQNRQYSRFLWDDDGTVRSVSQQGPGTDWSIQDLGDGTVHIVSLATGEYLDLDIVSGWPSKEVHLKSAVEDGTRWRLIERAGGFYQIDNADHPNSKLQTYRGGRVNVTFSSFSRAQWSLIPLT